MIKRFLLPILAVGMIVSVSLARQDDSYPPPVPRGKPAPDITLHGLDGKAVKLSSLRGKPVFLDFWATWCGPCRMSLPHTDKLAKTGRGKINVLAISDEDVSTIKSFMKENKYTYPSFRDGDKSAGKKYQVQAIPTFVIIDKNGNLVDYVVGYDNEAVDKALAKVGIK